MPIPDKYQRSFQRLATMSEPDFNRLKEALANTPPAFDIETFAERVSVKDEGLGIHEISDLVAAVAPLMSVATDTSEVEHFAEWVSSSIESNEKLDVSKDTGAELRIRLRQLFAISDTLGTVAKARAIYFFQGNDFCDAKIVTDIRPIFLSDPGLEPKAAVLVHSLQIGYHVDRSPEHKEFTLTLDESELDSLEAAIQRARSKAETLVKMLSKMEMRCLKPEISQDTGI